MPVAIAVAVADRKKSKVGIIRQRSTGVSTFDRLLDERAVVPNRQATDTANKQNFGFVVR